MLAAGIDEAGRGALAGPVTACAVIIPAGAEIPALIRDSKKLSADQRAAMYEFIAANYVYAVGQASSREIDRLNILQATFLAMRRAVQKLKIQPELCLIDGNKIIPGLKIKQKAVVKGDAKIKVISAASIVAKVTRDRLMSELNARHPQYDFAGHKGYGTPAHVEAIKRYGRSPEHRRSFAYPGENEQQGLF
ncbi:MAG: ribonuclease HII [Candidatus Margulisbacteria bacterium]|jgi:ribonuclease HII|nr:ribonuclease HII [Candidatus Margulisiibacteriota bacterium]